MGFDDNAALLLSNVCQQNRYADAICLSPGSNDTSINLPRINLSIEHFPQTAKLFSTDCQAKSVPPSLLAMVHVILHVPYIKEQAAKPTEQEC